MIRIVLLTVVAILLFSAGCIVIGGKPAAAKKPTTSTKEKTIPSIVDWGGACLDVAIKDMDGDSDPDMIISTPHEVKYFENVGRGSFKDRGKIAEISGWQGYAGVGVAIDDLDKDGILEIVVASSSDIRIIKNPIAQKR